MSQHLPSLMPPRLKAGDKVRFVSPASTPDRLGVLLRAAILESWGLRVDFGAHAFDKRAYLAGSDAERLDDFNLALRDPAVRAIFATRGGKGSYRIADHLDFDAARRDPKFVVGFSDITVLHLSLLKQCGLVGLHGALAGDEGQVLADSAAALQSILFSNEPVMIRSRAGEPTAALTTSGGARGRLIGGNLSLIATAAGWALPPLEGAILLIEDVGTYLGQVDRQFTMLRKSGALRGLAGVAVGQFTGFENSGSLTIIDLLGEHLAELGVPILGGLPLGHGEHPLSVPVGAVAEIDAAAGELRVG